MFWECLSFVVRRSVSLGVGRRSKTSHTRLGGASGIADSTRQTWSRPESDRSWNPDFQLRQEPIQAHESIPQTGLVSESDPGASSHSSDSQLPATSLQPRGRTNSRRELAGPPKRIESPRHLDFGAVAASSPLWRVRPDLVGPAPHSFDPVISTSPVAGPGVGTTARGVTGAAQRDAPLRPNAWRDAR